MFINICFLTFFFYLFYQWIDYRLFHLFALAVSLAVANVIIISIIIVNI